MDYLRRAKKWLREKAKEDPVKAERRRVQAIMDKQKKMRKDEINLELNFVFGHEKPRKRKEVCKLKNVTLRNVWMEELFLFRQIESYRPGEVFHSPDKYLLMFRPSSSPFTMLISLTDRVLQEEAVRNIDKLDKGEKKRLLFHLVTADQSMSMFNVKVHKSSLESYRTKTEVLNKLCDLYVCGRIPLGEFNMTMDGGYEGWKQTVYNFLAPDEQEYHRYLCKPTIKHVEKSNERKYMDDDITLQGYEDLKYPERKERRDAEALTYPRPYTQGPCVICKSDEGLIKCLQCPNLVCRNCIITEFLNENSSCGSFMLVHRRYCMRFGHVPDVAVDPMPVPGNLNTLRLTGKKRAESLLLRPQHEIDDEDGTGEEHDTDTDIEVDLEAQRKEEEARRHAAAITDMRQLIQKAQHKLGKVFKTISEYQLIIDDNKRTQQMRDRTRRLIDEEIANYELHVRPKRLAVDDAWASSPPQLVKIDKTLQTLYDNYTSNCDKLDRLIMSESFAAYEAREIELSILAENRKKKEIEDSLRLV